MRVFIMFDLPVETRAQVRTYTRFRKKLIEDGFLMMQYSIYIRSCANKDAADMVVNNVKKYIPKDGHVRAMVITEKQFEKMMILVGEEDKNIALLGDNRTLEL
ncbi:CRISPR-associated endonuclease Cas2 [Alkalicoccus saliphilus]|jgi:CRISPR-associated protein Cas2|uniref:CRISPR-associated endoribonuclease Cas2 n=1 Tax=Alkalicoccus saliphilus TaxID=200989 RepID=A0A2T4U5T2_9BACI|nr:CRISPR-associated endonuclease Cas2 [Alkalicoccus saliphilus]PTL38754.1 CRISPR-associated endonuclease Cas2 [Alkalicoccus saliphilus]